MSEPSENPEGVALFDLDSVKQDSPRLQELKAAEVMTHHTPHCPKGPWLAIPMKLAREILDGYSPRPEELSSIANLTASYGRILDDAGLTFFGDSERDVQDDALAHLRSLEAKSKPEPKRPIDLVRRHNRWRRGDDTLAMEHPKEIGEALDTLCDQVEDLERENLRLRAIFPKILQALESGGCTSTASVEFMEWIPDEVRLVTAKRNRESAALRDALRECREDSVELLGERDWWKDETRRNYAKRYHETAENIRRADALLTENSTQ